MPVTRRPIGARPPLAACLALGLGLAIAACGGSTVSPTRAPSRAASPGAALSASPSPSETASPTPSQSPASQPGQPGSQTVDPSSPAVAIGASEPISVFTHCGFAGHLDWAGSFWQETGRSPEGGPIGDPEDMGLITLLTHTTAKFVSSTGTVVALERLDGAVQLQPCD